MHYTVYSLQYTARFLTVLEMSLVSVYYLCLLLSVVQGDNSCLDKKIKNVKEIDWIFQNGTFCIGRAICIDGMLKIC